MHIYNLSQHQFFERGRTVIKQSDVISKCMADVAVVFTLSDSFFLGLKEMRSYVGMKPS